MITLIQYNGSNVTPQDDAILYDFLVQDSGVLFGCTVTHLGAGQLQVADGRGIIQGRNFVVEAQTVQATLAESGTLPGRLLIQVDVANSEEPISFVVQAQDPLPDLVQEDINGSGSIFQLPLATYTAEVTQISGLTSVIHTLTPILRTPATGSTLGMVTLSDAINSSSGASDGVAATPAAVKSAVEQTTPDTVTVQTTTSWASQSTTAGTEYWEQSVTIPGLGASDQVDIALDADGLNQLLEDGVTALWAENTDGACVIKALGAAPTVALTLHLTLTEVSST